MDVHVRLPVTTALRRRGIDVLTAQQDGATRFPDPKLLDRATQLKRVLFSQDDDLLVEASRRQKLAISFGGLIYAHQQNITVRQAIDDLELIALAATPAELADRIVFLPLT
jgi:hypothetical protein